MSVREFLNTRGGYMAVGAIILVAVGAFYYSFKAVFGRPEYETHSTFIDSKTGKVFKVELEVGMKTSPLESNPNAYPAEPCYWTKDGKIKDKPTWVLLNSYIKKSGPTICPDCERVVIPQSGKPGPGADPPPLASSLKSQNSNR